MPKDDAFSFSKVPDPHAFVQWKGTDVCMDFHCDCGAHCHFDGMFAYAVKCQHCGAEWEMPFNLFPRRKPASSQALVQLLEPDEAYADEIVDAEGVTQIVARPVS